MHTPAFWSAEHSLLATILSPLGGFYAAATARRLTAGEHFRAAVPVISVGNVTAGGSGKTPLVQAIVRQAQLRGIAVHCLTRGYGGIEKGPLRVDPDRHAAAAVGDEPLLLAALAPTWVSRDRKVGAIAAIAAGARLLVLDDGLQNPALSYDLSLLAVDGGFGFGNGKCLPAGPLREPIAKAAARVSAAIIIGADASHARARLPAGLPVLEARIVPRAYDVVGADVVAFAGLGRPEKFRQTLADIGANVRAWMRFADHHAFTDGDLSRLADLAANHKARLVTTEKDFVRLPLAFRAGVTPLTIDLVPDDQASFEALLAPIFAKAAT